MREPTAAIEGAELLQAPPGEGLTRVDVVPAQIVVIPPIGAGSGSTVIITVAWHPLGDKVYEIAEVPAASPDTKPEVTPTVAMVGLLLVQYPPGVASDNAEPEPTQVPIVPVIAAGKGSTVNTVVSEHPETPVYVIVVIPATMPLITPESTPIVATPGEPDDQLPPAGMPEITVEVPWQISKIPAIPVGAGLTVTSTAA